MAASTEPIQTARRPERPARLRRRLVIVSNRLPTTARLDAQTVTLVPSSGGLASGLRCVHDDIGRIWVGWPGVAADIAPRIQRELDTCLGEAGAVAVPLRRAEVVGFYEQFANCILWPLLHGEPPTQPVSSSEWSMYRAVNARYAEVVLRELEPGDRVWIHDYQLMLLPRILRCHRPDLRIGFFLHTPFPPVEVFARLPGGEALLEGVLGADAVGFHTAAYVTNFTAAVQQLLGRQVQRASGVSLVSGVDHQTRLHASPMSVDAAAFATRASDCRVTARVAALRAGGGPLLLGIDRLDPTKGIPGRLDAFARLLEIRPELRGRVRLFQLAVPSRETVPAYRALRTRVATMVAQLNARFGTDSWKPVEYQYGTVDPIELVARYRAADVMLVTSVQDGMNLVAKEFVASRTDDDGVLVLSRHAGAAAELTAALLVDPQDVDALARAYTTAIDMSRAERRIRMRHLRRRVRVHDVQHWAEDCLGHLDPRGNSIRRTAFVTRVSVQPEERLLHS